MEYKVPAIRGKRDRLDVIIYTQKHKIEGTLHSMPGSRLVDYLNSKTNSLFLVVTSARVYTLPELQLIHSAEFFIVNRDAIMMVFPRQYSESPGQVTDRQ